MLTISGLPVASAVVESSPDSSPSAVRVADVSLGGTKRTRWGKRSARPFMSHWLWGRLVLWCHLMAPSWAMFSQHPPLLGPVRISLTQALGWHLQEARQQDRLKEDRSQVHRPSAPPPASESQDAATSVAHVEGDPSKSTKRTRRADGADFVSFNGSCWPTAKEFLGRTQARVVLSQELKLHGTSKAEAEAWCINHGWKAFITECTFTELGQPSAGVGIFVRKYIGASRLEGPQASEGRGCGVVPHWSAAVHLNFAMKGGLIAMSMYQESGKGIGPETDTWQRLLRAGEFVRYFGLPFVIGGDFNTTPAVLEASGWPHSIHGRIQAAAGGSCRSSQGKWSTIDYFIVSRQLTQAIEAVHVVGSEPPIPHLPVRLKLARNPRSLREWALKRVKQFLL